MSRKLFITGTDTGVGKSLVSAGLLRGLAQQNLAVVGMKPLATGGIKYGNQLVNTDALLLMQSASIKLKYEQINPLIFAPAIAPHIAAWQQNQSLSAADLYSRCLSTLNYPADVCLIEGVGGWLTPLNEQETMADFVKLTGSKVLLVVGMRLGCLNHALLTEAAIHQSGLSLLGWVANCVDPDMECLEHNIATLQKRMHAPCLGIVPYDFAYSKMMDFIIGHL